MRRVIMFLLFCLSFLLFTACFKKEVGLTSDETIEFEDSSDVDDEEFEWRRPPDIAFIGLENVMEHVLPTLEQVEYDSVPTIVTITVNNKSEWDIVSKPGYEISRKNGDHWELLDMTKIVFDQGIDSIKKGGKKTFSIDLFSDKLSYKEGVYLISKPFEFEWASFEQEVEFVIK